jgi:hypothetical protein
VNADEINRIQEQHEKITEAIARAIKEDKNLVLESDRWVAHLIWAGDIQFYSATATDRVVGHASVYTQMTGGSWEQAEFDIPLDTLNKFL